jgi:hypothetical protein
MFIIMNKDVNCYGWDCSAYVQDAVFIYILFFCTKITQKKKNIDVRN